MKRQKITIHQNKKSAVSFATDHFLASAKEAIKKKGSFFTALSGGSTPKAVFQALAAHPDQNQIEWDKVFIFWGDERCVPPDNPESNYKMAMDNGIGQLPIPSKNIFRMKGELDPKEAATEYMAIIKDKVPGSVFDLILLGMGDDGHTASLFPDTDALQVANQYVVANWVPKVNMWRLTFTFPLINLAKETNLYVLGSSKAPMIHAIFNEKKRPPIYFIGTDEHPSLWILDQESASLLKS